MDKTCWILVGGLTLITYTIIFLTSGNTPSDCIPDILGMTKNC